MSKNPLKEGLISGEENPKEYSNTDLCSKR
jgi:hypothetical protein